ncbi:MAG: tRNA uridine-5-carboxymethylaminomethyl(34) synthesis GTPase MnmE [Acidobacteria bacterium]|nr:tRNA uridine-5-carboxymethylaminomethyl(34) synthesis GTPase MnmE [Acidobacteriota bacterium]
MYTDDTIAAIATPSGHGGIGIVRLSGGKSWKIAGLILRPRQEGTNREGIPLEPWRTHLAVVASEEGDAIDHALVTSFRKPQSYTAEDMVEIACHGSPVVLRLVLERCLAAGARLAEPGEFTMRAFLNGRIDLAQAEAVRDLIEARTLFQAKVAAQQVEGSVAQWVSPIKRELTDLIAFLEAGIDFAEDDVSVMNTPEIISRMDRVMIPLGRSRETFAAARIAHDGLNLAIVGRPNVGKSSLFNRLIQQDRAIVTATPGTTRDLVSETVEIDGIPLRFVDTAGIRQAFDEAESIGIRKSQEAAADSDLTLLVIDGTACADGLAGDDQALLQRLTAAGKLLVVINKCDLPLPISRPELANQIGTAALRLTSEESADKLLVQFVSALDGAGIAELRRAILAQADPALAGQRETQLLTNLRHQQAVTAAHECLRAARQAAETHLPHEMLLLDLYAALRSLDELTGATTSEDILTKIFSTFCIGK